MTSNIQQTSLFSKAADRFAAFQMPSINKVNSSPATCSKKPSQDGLLKKAKTIMRSLQNLAVDNNCELLLCLKDKTGSIEQLSTSPENLNIGQMAADLRQNTALNLSNEDSIKQFVIALQNDMRLSSAASTVDTNTKRDSDE